MKGMAGHERGYRGKTDVWPTPPELLGRLGWFDLDPCAAPKPRPWDTAVTMITERGLEADWIGRVWLNPPYGPQTGKWLEKLADHGNGTALVFARTDTRWFQEQVLRRADGILFLRSRLTFYREDGILAPHNAGAPSVLIAYGQENAQRLWLLRDLGFYMPLRAVEVLR